jgi:hypothetical protein
MSETIELVWCVGGYPHTYRPSVAGQWGCDRCWGCDQRPAAGARVWMNSYGDLYCDPCAQRLASSHARHVHRPDCRTELAKDAAELATQPRHYYVRDGDVYGDRPDLKF